MSKLYRVSAGRKNIKLRQTNVLPLSGNGQDVPWTWPTERDYPFPAIAGRSVTVRAVDYVTAVDIYTDYTNRA